MGSEVLDFSSDLARRFETDVEGIYTKAKAVGYNATRYLVTLRQHGGLETAHRLLASREIGYGFAELWMLGRLDLTVEALVLRPEYIGLFKDGELATARERLGR